MATPLALPKGYKRLDAFPIDEDSIFTTQEALDAYLAGGTSYPGQVVALVVEGADEALVFKINPDKTLGTIGGESSRSLNGSIALANNSTMDIMANNDKLTYEIANGVTAIGFTVSVSKPDKEFTAKRILDNSGNDQAVVLGWGDDNLKWTWLEAVPVTGLSSIPANSIYVLEIEVESASEVLAMIAPKSV